jgi:hypothetical protein
MNTSSHHVLDCAAPLGPVKPLRFAPTPPGLAGLTGTSVAPNGGQLRDGPGCCSASNPSSWALSSKRGGIQ